MLSAMKTILSIALVFIAALASRVSAESSDQKRHIDETALQGDWLPTKAELGGKPMSDDVLKTITLKLTKNNYEV